MTELAPLRQPAMALDEARKIYPDIPATTVSIFVLVAANAGISSKGILHRLPDASQSAISRHLALLGAYSWRGGPGLGLIDVVEDPADRRNKIAFLTEKGRQLAVRLIACIQPDSAAPEATAFLSAADYLERSRSRKA